MSLDDPEAGSLVLALRIHRLEVTNINLGRITPMRRVFDQNA